LILVIHVKEDSVGNTNYSNWHKSKILCNKW